jgi:hypothetical protein
MTKYSFLPTALLLFTMPLPGMASSVQAPSTAPPITEAELIRRTRQLYDALVPGDKTPWAAYYADDAMSYDEKGRAMDKTAILADVEPMPKGYSGSIKVVKTKPSTDSSSTPATTPSTPGSTATASGRSS